jgi:hypothetical protein
MDCALFQTNTLIDFIEDLGYSGKDLDDDGFIKLHGMALDLRTTLQILEGFAVSKDNFLKLLQELRVAYQENAQLRGENNKLKIELFWLRADSAPYNWDENSMPWGFSES